MVGFPARGKPFNDEKWPISSFGITAKDKNVSERYVLIFGAKYQRKGTWLSWSTWSSWSSWALGHTGKPGHPGQNGTDRTDRSDI